MPVLFAVNKGADNTEGRKDVSTEVAGNKPHVTHTPRNKHAPSPAARPDCTRFKHAGEETFLLFVAIAPTLTSCFSATLWGPYDLFATL
jgi:hypothetical protein